MVSSFDQSSYQVRFEWGIAGLARLQPADVIVVVDVLRFSTAATSAVEAGRVIPLRAELSRNGAPIAAAAAAHAARGATVLLGCLRNRSALADLIVQEQHGRGGRVSVAVIAAGERAPRRAPVPMLLGPLPRDTRDEAARAPDVPTATDEPPRFSVEDLLGAGAIIDALLTRGIDHCSPEAAVAAEGFAALQRGLGHLLGASGSGRELSANGLGADVAHAAELDASTAVPVLRDGVFVRGGPTAG